MRVFKMRPSIGGPWLICSNPEEVAAMLMESDVPASYTVSVVQMPEEQFRSLPEFEGW